MYQLVNALCIFNIYLNFSHLLAKGFVNPIPRLERQQGEEDRRAAGGCGFGEGDVAEGAKDVGAEVECTEQIEGLKGEK